MDDCRPHLLPLYSSVDPSQCARPPSELCGNLDAAATQGVRRLIAQLLLQDSCITRGIQCPGAPLLDIVLWTVCGECEAGSVWCSRPEISGATDSGHLLHSRCDSALHSAGLHHHVAPNIGLGNIYEFPYNNFLRFHLMWISS